MNPSNSRAMSGPMDVDKDHDDGHDVEKTTEKAGATAAASETGVTSTLDMQLPDNRFELELEFVEALASPAYLHFLATSRTEDGDGTTILQDPAFMAFLRYLRETWTRPEYSRFLLYPQALYFLDLLIERPAVLKELTLPSFRNFCHQQQFLAWQHRHSVCYGVGTHRPAEVGSLDAAAIEKKADEEEHKASAT